MEIDALQNQFSDTPWRKTSFCNHGACVEVAFSQDKLKVAIRDSKNPSGPKLIFTNQEWESFLKGVQAGEFTLPVQ